jgi:hypothetical protein
MRRARKHLTYANVVATIAAFVVLCGGAALAANQLAKSSVGKKQLKANAVTTAKIKKNAVTARKIRADAVDGSKVTAGGLGAADFDFAGMPYTRIVEELRAPVDIAAGPLPVIVPLPSNFAYTQEAGRIDTYIGAVDATFDPGCTNGGAGAFLLMDPPAGIKPDFTAIVYVVAAGFVEEEGPGKGTKRIHLGTYPGGGSEFAPSAAQGHTFSLLFSASCEAGSGVTAKSVALDVIGTK